jgi:hypothetical protein
MSCWTDFITTLIRLKTAALCVNLISACHMFVLRIWRDRI